jgi:hypothetical protein
MAFVEQVPRERLTELISDLGLGNLFEDEVDSLNRWMKLSPLMWYGKASGDLLAVWGLIPPTLLSDQAYLWMITTEAAQEHQFILVRQGQIEMKRMLEVYPRIVGHCEVVAERSIRWLRWLGATFGEPDGKMIPFVIGRQA